MKSALFNLLTGSLLLSAAMAGETGPSTGAVARDVPLGHKDFYPSPQRPVGFRGDGNGCFPGATPVAEFWDGTPAQVDRPLMTESFGITVTRHASGKNIPVEGTAKVWDVTDETSKNIVWKTRLPGWSLADPVVVGDRIFAVGEPDWLTCVDAHSGKVLWQTRVLPLLCDGKTPEEAARLQQVIDIATVFKILFGSHGSSLFSWQTRSGSPVCSPESVIAPMTAKLVERLPAWRKTIQETDNDPKLLEAFDRSAAAIANRANADFDRRVLKSFVEAVEKKYRVSVGTEWFGYIGNAMSTPVSDGERVYVVYGQKQVAAYGLDGRLVWANRLGGSGYGAFNGSMLCDNVLIIKSDGQSWRALDARTGKLLWERKDTAKYEYTTTQWVRLRTAQGEPVNAVLYPGSLQIRRPQDDRVLGEFPDTPRAERGYLFLVHHDLVLLVIPFQPPKKGNKTAVIYRLRATATDRVDVEEVYELPIYKLGAGFLAATPEHVVLQTRERAPIALYPLAGGEPRTTTVPYAPGEVGTTLVAGRTLLSVLSPDGGNNAWWRGPRPDGSGQGGQGRPTDRKAMVRIVTADITDPAAVRILGDRNLLQEAGPASDIYVEQYLKDMDPFLFAGCYHGAASWFGGLMSSMTPSGNRLFIQSAAHLRCIGDPAVQYDWNPQSRPAHITNALKSKETPKQGAVKP